MPTISMFYGILIQMFWQDHAPPHFRALYGEYKVFSAVGLEHGVVTWPEEIDLAPDAMYDAIKAHGKWVLNG